MCGILVYNGKNQQNFDFGLRSIEHRGPDSMGSKSFTYEGDRQLILGHVRLSIIDIDERSSQPFTLDNENFLVYNGEIYNYLELKQKYLSNIEMRTTSDTEVLWYLLKHHGVNIFSELIGMFALSFYISKTGTLVAESEQYVTTNAASRAEAVTIQAVVSLTSNDYIECWIENDTDNTDVTVSFLNVIIEALN